MQELTKLREENVSMAKDMKKMLKSHLKTKSRLDDLASAEKAARLLEKVAMQVGRRFKLTDICAKYADFTVFTGIFVKNFNTEWLREG